MAAVVEAREWKNRTAVEICAGIGGLTRGVTKAGFEHLLCLDIDPICVPFLERLPELSNAEISAQDLRYTDFTRFKNRVGILSGGPPCQPWSSGGLRRGSEDDRDILGEMPTLISEVRPEAFVFENVAGLTTGQNKRYFDRLMNALKDADGSGSYGVLAAKFNAADFGVPQVRERVFIVGLRGQPAAAVHGCFEKVWERRTHRNPTISDAHRPAWKTVGEMLSQRDDPGGWRAWFGQNVGEQFDWGTSE
ncbi:DNA (cytosine-5-)-methyltransferase [Sphingomonas sp. H160509]|uniref:DNA cytosine methyltransferase n=1 Tax=Sphingomonas sp. H160509 TaxID=2955313 RepID=UPI0020985BC6|nr:DNA (cytosine-5-)-methyltransferase [Sphingomonas sp. H160509]MDD1449789.1 DNA (cytosine-5-)-methyltransferase [Sphingomonas sp. H160509]